VVAQEFLVRAAAPFLAMAVLSLVPVAVEWRRVRREPSEMPQLSNPTQLKSAILLGAMYAIVLLALAATREFLGHFGEPALYVVAAVSGLTDVDAVTLSTARMARTDPVIAAQGWRLILVAAMSNLGFKACVAGLIGGRALLRQIALLFSVPVIGGVILLWLW